MPTPPKNLSLFPESAYLAADEPFYFEDLARKNGYSLIAGVDEAGRGPLAGPVVASAVILPQGVVLDGTRDSKQMSAAARDQAFPLIQSEALTSGISVISHKYIDEFNILNASLEAMRQAVLALDPQPDFLLVDGVHKVPLPVRQWCIKKGDSLSRSISAASVLAKVYRDRIMAGYHQMYPAYGFDRHKGYGTASHLKALGQYGACPVHRMSFKGVI